MHKSPSWGDDGRQGMCTDINARGFTLVLAVSVGAFRACCLTTALATTRVPSGETYQCAPDAREQEWHRVCPPRQQSLKEGQK